MPDPTPDTPVTRKDLADMIDELGAELEVVDDKLDQVLEEPDEPPPPPLRTTFGAAVWSYTGAGDVRPSWQDMVDALALPDLACRRTYYTPTQGVPSHYSQGGLAVDVAVGRSSLVTFRPPAGSVASGDWDDQLVALLASKPAGIQWWLGLGNEDERAGINPADRVADTLHLIDLRDSTVSHDEIKITKVHMGYSFDQGWDAAAWLPPELCERLDGGLTINHYQTLTGTRRRWADIMATTIAGAAALGLNVNLGEWGYPEYDDDPALKPSIVAEVGSWCAEHDVQVACHYNTDRGTVSRDPRYLQTSSEATLAAFRELLAA